MADEIYNETIAKAHLDIVALFLLLRTAFRADRVVTLHNWAGFRQFSINQLVQMLQDRALALRGQNARDYLLKGVTNKAPDRSAIIGTIEVALKFLASEQGLPLDSEALTMLYTMAGVFELPEKALNPLIDRYFV
jgi:hypothetical protein